MPVFDDKMGSIGENNILPTGWISVFTSIAFAYSGLCIYHGRTPLRPKRELSTTRWGKMAPYMCSLSYLLCWVAFPLLNLLGHTMDTWYSTTIQLYPVSAITWGPMLWTGFFSYMVGVEGSLLSERERDEKPTASSSDTESEPKSTDIDPELGGRAARDEGRLQLHRRKFMLCLWTIIMAMHTYGLNFWISMMLKAHDTSVNWVQSSWFLLVLISGFCMGGIRFGFEGRENANGWDLLVRFLTFFTFFVFVVSYICTHIVLAATSRTMLGGIPVFDGSSWSMVEGSYCITFLLVFLPLLTLSHF